MCLILSEFPSVFNMFKYIPMCNKSFQEKFVKGVHKLVAQYLSDGRQKVLQNYMIWRVVASFYPDQPSEEYHRYGVSIKVVPVLTQPCF